MGNAASMPKTRKNTPTAHYQTMDGVAKKISNKIDYEIQRAKAAESKTIKLLLLGTNFS